MGSDFQTRQFFCGSRDMVECRRSVMEVVRQHLLESGYEEVETEEEGDRSLVFGPPGRWLHIGDTTGTHGFEHPVAFDALSRELSRHGATVDILMCDSFDLRLRLFQKGRLVDAFRNHLPGGTPVKPHYAHYPWLYRGHPARWKLVLPLDEKPEALQKAWEHPWGVSWMLKDTARVLGWHPELAFVGYTHDLEGVDIKYDGYLKRIGADITGFDEMHFRIYEDCDEAVILDRKANA